MKLKKQFQLTGQEKQRIRELNSLFITGDHEYLNGGKVLPKRLKEEINELYFKYLVKINRGFTSILDIELDDLRQDNICRGSDNKTYWVKAYMLGWLAELDEELTVEKCFAQLTCGTAVRILTSQAYK